MVWGPRRVEFREEGGVRMQPTMCLWHADMRLGLYCISSSFTWASHNPALRRAELHKVSLPAPLGLAYRRPLESDGRCPLPFSAYERAECVAFAALSIPASP